MNYKKFSNVISVIGIGFLAVSLQGCIAAAIGGGIGAYKWGSSKSSEAETQCKKEYPDYYLKMQNVNKARSQQKQKPEAIMTIEEYCHLDPKEETKSATEK
jgi:hypothetical protein